MRNRAGTGSTGIYSFHPHAHLLPLRSLKISSKPNPPPSAGVGGAGIYAVGFNNPVTLVPWAREMMSQGQKYDWVICLIGINDLLRMGKPADDVSKDMLRMRWRWEWGWGAVCEWMVCPNGRHIHVRG